MIGETRLNVKNLGIEVRAGLHTGEVELHDDDVAGLGVAIGARVGAFTTMYYVRSE